MEGGWEVTAGGWQLRVWSPAEQLQGLGLGRGGESVVADALVGATRGHGGAQQLLGADRFFLVTFIRRIAAENLFQLAGR
ncbi:hypothetical protein D3C86_1940290 [compost metagenome]